MKKHSTAKVVLITMVIFLLLTWILPAAYYSGEYTEQGRIQMGLFDMFNYPLTALSYFGYIALFFVLVGGFYGVLYKIPAYRSFLDRIVKISKGKEAIILSLMVLIIALLVSICGVQIAIAIFIPFIVSLILLMGYDKIVAALVVVGSISAGLIGSTYAYSNLSVLLETFGLKIQYQILIRFVILLVGIVLVIFNTLMYIKRNMVKTRIENKSAKKVEVKEEKVNTNKKEVKTETRKTTKKTTSNKSGNSSTKKSTKSSKSRKSDNKAALKDEDIIVVKDNILDDDLIPDNVKSKYKVWPFVLMFSLLFILFVLAFITWADKGFGIALFDDITKDVQKFELFGFPLFAKILGTVNSFGNWAITDMFLPLMLVALLLVFIYKIKFEVALDGFISGAKKALAPAVIVILVYTVLVLVTYHPFQMVIYHSLLGKKFNIVITVLISMLSTLFNSDMVYSFQSVVPYYSSVITKTADRSLAAIIFQTMYGLTALVAPTSLILMATLTYLKVSYKDWLKNIWKLLLEFFIILLIIFIIIASL